MTRVSLGLLFILLIVHLPAFGQAGSTPQPGSVEYKYDALGRLERTTYTAGGSITESGIIDYTYDENGNRTEVLIQKPGETAVIPETEYEDGVGPTQIIVVPNGSGGFNIIVVGG